MKVYNYLNLVSKNTLLPTLLHGANTLSVTGHTF